MKKDELDGDDVIISSARADGEWVWAKPKPRREHEKSYHVLGPAERAWAAQRVCESCWEGRFWESLFGLGSPDKPVPTTVSKNNFYGAAGPGGGPGAAGAAAGPGGGWFVKVVEKKEKVIAIEEMTCTSCAEAPAPAGLFCRAFSCDILAKKVMLKRQVQK